MSIEKLTLDQFNQLYLESREQSERVEHTEMIIARCYHPYLEQILLIADIEEGIAIVHHNDDLLGKSLLPNIPALKTSSCISEA
ncbi:MAG: hypothetical protein M8364_01985 [Methylobacter sp.]|uniref:hypothetical protein n=1 Tax=Methylobacter sp. TaxID=2051955 RepID=UPI002587D810|nr:hypothetical protein [Methylobacter sp.]MCL7419663.1 hypothetical protein [Methylobacter sp.]